uniref:CSON007779 protein n=1 Tax=Culicoides sonorensis TaxID=179676 RepID=A0A336M1L2_CULSO
MELQEELNEILLEYTNQGSASNELEDEINSVCRTCLSSEANLKSMFEEYTYIPVFLMSFAAVETPAVNDGLSGSICTKCIDQINEIYNFRKQIELADVKLRRVLNENDPNSDEEELIEEQLETEDYSNLDDTLLDPGDIDMDHILSLPLPMFEKSQKLEDSSITFEEESENGKNIIIASSNCETSQTSNESIALLEPEVPQQNKISCEKCKDTFENEFDYKLHSTIHTKCVVCAHCKKDCGNQKSLKRHITCHFIVKPFKCSKCNQRFSELASLNRHTKKVHLGIGKEKKINCELCQQQFFDKYSLEVHIRSKHTLLKPFTCTHCNKSFCDRRLLKSHEKIHSNVKDYICSMCNQGFKHRGTLVAHLRNHTLERPFTCHICNSGFKQKSHLNKHLLIHIGEKPYVCNICQKRFTASSSLKSHEKIHTGEKPYECEICKKKFSRKDLRAHYSTHTGQKDFVCNENGCDKAYATQSLLNMHRKIKHSDSNPFVCTIEGCGKKFSSDINLKKHVKSHERKNTETLVNNNGPSTSFIGENRKSLALCVMDELDQFMKQHQFNTNSNNNS